MSVLFRCESRELWNPSSKVARIFTDLTLSIEREFGVWSGMTNIGGDEVEIYRDEFLTYVALGRDEVFCLNPPGHKLVAGYLELCEEMLGKLLVD